MFENIEETSNILINLMQKPTQEGDGLGPEDTALYFGAPYTPWPNTKLEITSRLKALSSAA